MFASRLMLIIFNVRVDYIVHQACHENSILFSHAVRPRREMLTLGDTLAPSRTNVGNAVISVFD